MSDLEWDRYCALVAAYAPYRAIRERLRKTFHRCLTVDVTGQYPAGDYSCIECGAKLKTYRRY